MPETFESFRRGFVRPSGGGPHRRSSFKDLERGGGGFFLRRPPADGTGETRVRIVVRSSIEEGASKGQEYETGIE